MSRSSSWSRRCVGFALWSGALCARAQQPLDVETYVETVRRAHPVGAARAGLVAAAQADRRAARRLPDPLFELTWARARSVEGPGSSAAEIGYAVSQTLPWPGTRRATIAAADQAAEISGAQADGLTWELEARARLGFARLEIARGLLDVARGAEQDARALHELLTRRAELGESRESDRIKATVEWLRQQSRLAAAAREAEAAESALRALAVEPLPRPLALAGRPWTPALGLDAAAQAARLSETSPRVRAARAEAARRRALASVARRERVPELELSLFRERELDRTAHGFAFGVRVPLWSLRRAEIARAEAEQQTAVAAAQRERLDVAEELEARLGELRVASEQAALLERELVPQAARSLELARLLYEEGETSLLDLLDAQRTLRDAERELLEARWTQAVAAAGVQRAAGSGPEPWGNTR